MMVKQQQGREDYEPMRAGHLIKNQMLRYGLSTCRQQTRPRAPESLWSLSNVKLRKQVRNIVSLSEERKLFEVSLLGNCYMRWLAQPLATLFLELIYNFYKKRFYL